MGTQNPVPGEPPRKAPARRGCSLFALLLLTGAAALAGALGHGVAAALWP